MQAIPQPGLALYNSQIEASREVAEAVFHGIEKAEKLALEAAHKNFDSAFKFAAALTAARDPQGIATLQNTFFGQSPEAALDYQKQMAQIMMEMHSSFGHAFETLLQGAKSGTETAAATSVAGMNGSGGMLTGFMPMWDSAFKEFAKSANRVMHAADLSHSVKKPAATKQRGARAH